jgi:penicillin-binding protein 1A
VILTLLVFGILVLVAVLSAVGYVITIAATAPDLDELKPIDKGKSSVVYAADGSRLGYVQSDVIRVPIARRRMPRNLRRAVVAIEDERFYKHKGVDYPGVIRAGVRNLQSRKTVQGGSTITQQLVRALYIKDAKRDLPRKIREAKLASELEKKHNKDWILTEYLNSVPFGTVNGKTAVGVEGAASVFFAKHARDLTLEEAALLAGLPQAPSEYNPFRNPSAALERRNEVLRQMAKQGYITQERYQRAIQRPLGTNPGRRFLSRREPYVFDFVSEELIQRYGINKYRQGGLEIRTTIDPKLQDAARQAIANRLNQPGDPSSAIVSIDSRTGYIRAMAASGTYRKRSFNLAAQGHRQPGSSFKTFALVTAIRRGVNPNTTSYVSQPLDLKTPYGPWKVKTYGGTYSGRENLVRATLSSDNTVYAQLALDLGPDKIAETARLMGVQTKLDGLPAETLGGLTRGVSPLEMASAYSTLSAYGMRSKPKVVKSVKFPDGKVDEIGEPDRKRVFPDGVAYETTKILEQNVKGGTGTAAQIGCAAAGKTGTTDNFTDAWFVGYTPHLATAVWVGYPDSRVEMRSVHGISVAGGTFPAQIWHDFMNVAKGSNCDSFPPAQNPVTWTPFFGKYSKTGTGKDNSYSYQNGQYKYQAPSGGTQGGGAPYKGYDPRLYDSPPQEAPKPPPPPPPAGPPGQEKKKSKGEAGPGDGGTVVPGTTG